MRDPEPKLKALPAVIDPHVHFRVPGGEYKEDWKTGALAAIAGGVTTVFDMPNNTPPVITAAGLEQKRSVIDQQLKEVGIPLRTHLYLGAAHGHFDEMVRAAGRMVALKVFMGCSTGNLLVSDLPSLQTVFATAALNNVIVAVHAEDEARLEERKKMFTGRTDIAVHSEIRDRQAAYIAVNKAIGLSREFGTKLYLLHLSTAEEMDLVRAAKKEGLPVYAETTPHHLFLSVDDYPRLQAKGQMNPPLRTREDQLALWSAIEDGTIDTIGSDHAPHTLEEKALPYPASPSGVPGVEMILPLLLNAYHDGLVTLDKLVAITSGNCRRIFGLPDNDDMVLVDLDKTAVVADENVFSKCCWSPYSGMELRGWPMFTLLENTSYDLEALRRSRTESPDTSLVT